MLIGYFDMESEAQQLVLESSLESIEAVETLISKMKEQHSIPEESYNGIWIALNEALTNAIKHGNKYDPAKKVCLSVETKGNRYICFTVKDEGSGFDPSNVPDPTSPGCLEEPNGRGVFLINRLADTVKFSDNGTMLEMCFDLFKN
ncbi:MAG: ATP-binding protein [Bacteroidetes bacterium]|nr:ATP-binding protein [Bacteroidota bacterium]